MQPQTLRSSGSYAQYSPTQKLRKNMILNHTAADIAVQRKLCPNFKSRLLKKLRKNIEINSVRRTAGGLDQINNHCTT